MLRVLTIIFLLGLSFESFAGDLQVRNGKLAYPLTEKFNENGFRPWKIIGGGIDQEYQSRFDKSLHVREASTGLRSASTVPVTIEAQVSRKAVLSGAFNLVKRGAALGTRLSGWGTAAYFAYEAYQAVKSDLEFEGYKYDEGSNEFLKEWPARNCLRKEVNGSYVNVGCYGIDSSIVRLRGTRDKTKQKEVEYLMQAQMEKLAIQFWEKEKEERGNVTGGVQWTKYVLDACHFDWNGGYCVVKSGNDLRNSVQFTLTMRDTEVLDNEKFLKISTPSIDANPTPFVEGTGKPEYNEKVSVPAGTVVTIGPVTPENGKPVQITITFGQDSNGNSTAKVETTPRPDLIPGSPAAPKTNPTPTPGENGKPGSQPDPTPDGSPSDKPKPDPDDSPSGKDNPKPDDKPDPDGKDDPKKDERPKEDDKPKEDGGLLCKVFPNILACDELPGKEEPDLEIPEEQIDLNFTPDNTFREYGECPAPVMFQALGAEYKISLEPACNLAAMMRPFIIAMAWLVASFFVARVVRNNA